MLFYTHLLFAFLVSIYTLPLSFHNIIPYLLILIGSVFPDIDNSNSFIANKTKIHFVGKITRHRTIFHSVWIMAFLYLIVYVFLRHYLIYLDYFLKG